MDPFSIILGFAIGAGLGASDHGDPFRYRKVLEWSDGWVATEVLSKSAVSVLSSAMDLDGLCCEWDAVDLGLRRIVAVTRKGGPLALAFVATFDRFGSTWELRAVYGPSYSRPSRPEQWQHLHEVQAEIGRDIGKEVAQMAASIPDPESRYRFLKAVVRKPALAARVTSDNDFASIVVSTTEIVHPERITAVAAGRGELPCFQSSLAVQPLPITDRASPRLIEGTR